MIAVGSRGRAWFDAFAGEERRVSGLPPSVLAADGEIDGNAVRFVSIVPDASGRFARARSGEVGIDEGVALARAVASSPHDLVAIVDVPGQAFGLREEIAGLHRALAAAVEAYVEARREGRAVAALVVGRAISGAFLAHGLQAQWIGALRDPGVEVHVMSAPAVARVTRMTREEIARIATIVPATARDVETFAKLGAVDALFDIADPERPAPDERMRVGAAIAAALRDPAIRARTPRSRLDAPGAAQTRRLAREVRERIATEW